MIVIITMMMIVGSQTIGDHNGLCFSKHPALQERCLATSLPPSWELCSRRSLRLKKKTPKSIVISGDHYCMLGLASFTDDRR